MGSNGPAPWHTSDPNSAGCVITAYAGVFGSQHQHAVNSNSLGNNRAVLHISTLGFTQQDIMDAPGACGQCGIWSKPVAFEPACNPCLSGHALPLVLRVEPKCSADRLFRSLGGVIQWAVFNSKKTCCPTGSDQVGVAGPGRIDAG